MSDCIPVAEHNLRAYLWALGLTQAEVDAEIERLKKERTEQARRGQ